MEYFTIAMIKSIIVVLKFRKIFYLDQTGLHFTWTRQVYILPGPDRSTFYLDQTGLHFLFDLEYPTGPEPINSISYIYYFLHLKKKHFFQETFNKNLFI